MRVAVVGVIAAILSACGPSRSAVAPVRTTAATPNDPDDPAIWMHPTDPAKSLILGTDKMEGTGGLYVFGIDGALRQVIAPLDRPNNVDVEYGFSMGGGPIDIAVVTERNQRRLRVFGVPVDGGRLIDLVPEGVPVLQGQAGEAGEPMGIALYKRQRDGTIFAVVAPKTGPAVNYLWQYRLQETNGRVEGRLVRRFGAFSRHGATPFEIGEIEAVVSDDALGYVYYADERFGIRKYHADPDRADAAAELAVLGRDGYEGDREGLAIYTNADGTGFLVSSDQILRRSRVMIYPREGRGGAHVQPLLAAVPTVSDDTDGLEVSARALPGLPAGMMVMMNSGPRNFLIYDWGAVRSRLSLRPSGR